MPNDKYTNMVAEQYATNLLEVKEHARILKEKLEEGKKIPKTGQQGTDMAHAAWLNAKVKNRMDLWGDLYGSTVLEVCDNIINDEKNWLASFFAKDPRKQNMSERFHIHELESAGFEVQDLSNKGVEQVTFTSGQRIVGPINDADREYGMNCDFCVHSKTSVHEIYITGKNTSGRGGLQTYQVKCVNHWLEGVISFIEANPDDTTLFAALTDGTTFTMSNNKYLNDLRKVAEEYPNRIFVGPVAEFISSEIANV